MIDARTRLLLEDMRDNARIAVDHIDSRTSDAFAADVTVVYATARAVEIVGEAAAQIDPAFRREAAAIPWRQAIDTRNKLIHGYRSLQPKILYETVRDNFPALIVEIERLLEEG